MAGPLIRWSSIALAAALLAGVACGFLRSWRFQRLAKEHASRAQKALDEMGTNFANIRICQEALKAAKLPSEKARYESLIKSSRRMLPKLEEVAVRHERMARSYGYKAPFKIRE